MAMKKKKKQKVSIDVLDESHRAQVIKFRENLKSEFEQHQAKALFIKQDEKDKPRKQNRSNSKTDIIQINDTVMNNYKQRLLKKEAMK